MSEMDARTGRYLGVGVPSWHPLPVQSVIGQSVREMREVRGWRQVELAHRLAVAGVTLDQSGVTRLETGQRQLSVDELLALCVVFGVTADRFLPKSGLDPDNDQAPFLQVGDGGMVSVEQARWSLSGGRRGSRMEALEPKDEDVVLGEYIIEERQMRAKVAKALGISPLEARVLAADLWGTSVSAHREQLLQQRVEEMTEQPSQRTQQAMRGHITRQLIEELSAHLANGTTSIKAKGKKR